MRRGESGFSLLEVAMVLLVMGILAGGMLSPLKGRMQQRQLEQTRQRLEQSTEVIVAYTLSLGYLPCPDTDADGVENRSGDDCAAEMGQLPWRDLGAPLNGHDAWSEPLLYVVTDSYANSASPSVLNLASVGDITINDEMGAKIAEKVPFLLLSHGQSRGFDSISEAENRDADRLFIAAEISTVAGREFDDQLFWVPNSLLKYRLIQAGKLP